MTKRVLKFLDETANRDPIAYNKWFLDFQFFIKEGKEGGSLFVRFLMIGWLGLAMDSDHTE